MTFKKTLAIAAGVLALTAPLASAATNRLVTTSSTNDPNGITVRRLINAEAPGEYVVEVSDPKANKFAATCTSGGVPLKTKLPGSIESMITMTIDGPKEGTIDCLLQTWMNETEAHQRKISFNSKPDLGPIKIHYDRDAKTKKNPRNFNVESKNAKEFTAACGNKKSGDPVETEFTPVKNGKTVMTLVDVHDPDVVICTIFAESDDALRSREFISDGK